MTYARAQRRHDRELIAKRSAALAAELKATPTEQDRLAWARRLKAREESGERLNEHMRRIWREALGERG